MHLSDFLWFLICVALLLLAMLGDDVREHSHLPETPYVALEFADQPAGAMLTGTEAADTWSGWDEDPDDAFDRVDLPGAWGGSRPAGAFVARRRRRFL